VRRFGAAITGLMCEASGGESSLTSDARPPTVTKTTRSRRRRTVATRGHALAAIAVVGFATAAPACGTQVPGARTNGAHTRVRADAKPRVLSLRYGRFRPAGAPHSQTALQIRARDPNGQIVSEDYRQLDPPGGAAYADSGCGLGGKRNGGVETFLIAIKLRPGRYRFRVSVQSSPCGHPGRPGSASRTFRILVK